MFKYKVFAQNLQHEFVQVAQTSELSAAEAVYEKYHEAMIMDFSGEVLQTKNLTSVDSALF